MAYRTLGWRNAAGAADTTGNNPGNWTVSFTPDLLSVSTQIPEWEIYKLILKGAAQTASFDIYIDGGLWDTNIYAAQNSWEPSNGLLIMRTGQTMFLYYTSASTDGHKPKVTAWLRHDPALTQVYPGG